MPRDGSGVYSPPNGTVPVVSNTVIASAPYNSLIADIVQDLNTPRPIAFGGTGATNGPDALVNLGAVGQSNFLDAFSIGDGFYSARTLDARWLKRDGALYDTADYPALAALLPSLPDGIEWTSIPTSVTGTIQAFLATAGGYYLGTRSGSDSNIYFSSDLTGWSLRATLANFNVNGLCEGAGIIGAIDGSGKGASSPDGVSWSSAITITGTEGLGDVAFGAGVFVAVGTNGSIYSSPDFVTWTPRTSGVSGLLYVVEYVNSVFVAAGGGGTITTSTTGTSGWTPRTSGVSSVLQGVAYGAGVYVIVAEGGGIISSSNLTTWTPRSSGTTNNLMDVVYSSSGFLAVGNGGVARISTNGTGWSVSVTGVSVNFFGAGVNPADPSQYLAVSNSSLISGLRTLTTQFRVPNDGTNPTYGWIKALDEVP